MQDLHMPKKHGNEFLIQNLAKMLNKIFSISFCPPEQG